MCYDSIKEHNGRRYTGMPVGGKHFWHYPHGLWSEEKLSPDKWRFSFTSRKERRQSAPVGSGAKVGTSYHWYIVANQRVHKVDANSYRTMMEGLKFKVGHKRPHWRNWSYEYPDQQPEMKRIIEILENTIADLKGRLS